MLHIAIYYYIKFIYKVVNDNVLSMITGADHKSSHFKQELKSLSKMLVSNERIFEESQCIEIKSSNDVYFL